MREKSLKVQRNNGRNELTPAITVPVTRAYSEATGDAYNWERVLLVLGKNARFVLTICGLIIIAVLTYTFHLKDIYAPVARLQIDPPGSTILTPRDQETINDDTQEYLETQSQILQSDELATRVIRSLRLDENPEIVGAKNLAEFGKTTNAKPNEELHKGLDGSLEDQFQAAERTPLENIALRVFRKSLSVGIVRGSRLVEVSYACNNPRLAQKITNDLVLQFIDQNFKTRYITTMQASEWLLGQLSDLRQKVEESNEAAVAYQKKHGLVEEDEKDGPTSQLASGISHQLAEAQADRIQSEAFVVMIDSGHAESLPQVQQSQIYQNAASQFVDASARLAQAKAIYGEENNSYKKLQNEVNELAAQQEAEKERIVKQVRTAYAAAMEREELMNASMTRLRAQMGDVNEQMVRYRVLKDESRANADLYNTLLGRLKEAGLYAGLKSSNIRVADPASVLDRPTSPHRWLIIAVGTLLSMIFAVALAFMRESVNNTIRTPKDVEAWTGLPSLAMIPLLPVNKVASTGSNRGRHTLGRGTTEIASPLPGVAVLTNYTMEAEAFRELRTSILLSNAVGKSPKAILVASPASGEGKSTVAIHLAITLAQLGKTCLIDGDIRKPVIAQVFGASSVWNWPDVLDGASTLNKTLVQTKESSNLWFLAVGPSQSDPGGLIDSPQMKALLAVLRSDFDFLVIDSPPVIPFSDARLLSLLVDGVVLVGQYGLTTRRALERSTECLRGVGAPIIGAVINGMDFSSPDYRYYNFGHSSGKLQRYYPEKKHPALDQPKGDDPPMANGVGA